MKLVLPPGMTRAKMDRALTAFAGVVGKQWVLATDEDRDTYLDVYAPGDEAEHAPAAAVAPASTEEVQAIVRLAGEHRTPIWPISRGKNMGYGGAAPVMPGTIVLDLSRMNRILELDARTGYCVLEAGVGFFDLYEHLTANKIPLWMAIPGNAWGSVIGNALDRGFSGSPYGEHTNSLCGLEVVLANGELVRTGTGAMANSATWPLFKYGYGPAWDQVFTQSNYGVVTKGGFWLMPEPESTITMAMKTPNPEDLGWLVETIHPLQLAGVIDHRVGITSYMGSATVASQRTEWFKGEGSLPDEAVGEIIRKYNVGWWNFSLRLYGDPRVNEAKQKVIQEAFAKHTDKPFTISRWNRGDAQGGAPRPSVLPLQVVNWHGGRGGHIGFSPILPPDPKKVLDQLALTRRRYREFGVDYSGTFYCSGRHLINVNLMLYDRDNAAMTRRTRDLFSTLVKDSAAAGYGEYRTHLSYMDEVAESFDFNNHALRRLNQTVKDALDPRGILAPGKSGIWPAAYRKGKA